jgi:hypothetical protein
MSRLSRLRPLSLGVAAVSVMVAADLIIHGAGGIDEAARATGLPVVP